MLIQQLLLVIRQVPMQLICANVAMHLHNMFLNAAVAPTKTPAIYWCCKNFTGQWQEYTEMPNYISKANIPATVMQQQRITTQQQLKLHHQRWMHMYVTTPKPK